MKIFSYLLLAFFLTNETLQTLDAKKVDTIKTFLRKLVQTSLDSFKKKLALEMREREQQQLQTKQNRKLFFGFFRHKKKKQKKKLEILKAGKVTPQVLSRTVDYSLQQEKPDDEFLDVYKRVEEEITIEKIVDQIVDEGFGEEMQWYLKMKLRAKRRKHRRHKYNQKYHFDYFDNLEKTKKKHKITVKKRKEKTGAREHLNNDWAKDPLLELYDNIYPETQPLKTQNVQPEKTKEQLKKQNDDELKELDDFLNNYYKNVSINKNDITKETQKVADDLNNWIFKKKI